MSLLDDALMLVAAGYAVIPIREMVDGVCTCPDGANCAKPGKHPQVSFADLSREAATSPMLMEAWWKKWPGAGIAILTGGRSTSPDDWNHSHGLLVADVDTRNGGDVERLAADLDMKPTAITGSKGAHFYLRAPRTAILTKALKDRPGVDLKWSGGFVIAPPSAHVSGNLYEWADGIPPLSVDAPAWLLDNASREPHKRGSGTVAGGAYALATFEAEIRRAAEVEPTDPEAGGRNDNLNSRAFRVGRVVAAGFVDEQVAKERLIEGGLEAGLEPAETKATAESGLRAGIDAGPLEQPEEEGAEELDAVLAEVQERCEARDPETEEKDRLAKVMLTPEALLALPPVRWTVDQVLQRAEVNLLLGQRASGKSLLALDLALTMATGGRAWLGQRVEPGPVVYVTLENVAGLRDRVQAWLKTKGLTHADLGDRFIVMAPAAGIALGRQDVALIARAAKQVGAALIVIDTLARFDPEAEGDAKDAGKTVAVLDALKRVTGATVLLVHHLGKDVSRGGRGSSALEAAVTQVVTAKKEGAGKVAVSITKSNNAEELDDAALVTIQGSPDGVGATLTVQTGWLTGAALDSLRMKAVLDAVAALTEKNGEPPSGRQIEDEVTGKAEEIRERVKTLVERGYLDRHKAPRGRGSVYTLTERNAQEWGHAA